MNPKFGIFVVLMLVTCIIMSYVKNILLYHPMVGIPQKYDKFYQKLMRLTECQKYVTNMRAKTPDNVWLDVIYIKNPDTDKCIIFFHGNSGNLSMRFDMIKFLYNYASVIMFDYRSYGKSTGHSVNLTEHALETDSLTIWQLAITDLNIKPCNICLFGESLGCSLAIILASKISQMMDANFYPQSLILNSPFSSLSSMVESYFQKMNIGFVGKILGYLVKNEYQSDEWIKYINHQTKIIIAHSPRDEVVPYKEGMHLYQVASNVTSRIKFVNISGTHNNLGLSDSYIYALADNFDD